MIEEQIVSESPEQNIRPQEKFKLSVLKMASKLDSLANTETSVTQRDAVNFIGIAAILGAIALFGQGENVRVDTLDFMEGVLKNLGYDGFLLDKGNFFISIDRERGVLNSRLDGLEDSMLLEDLARTILDGNSFKDFVHLSQPVHLLDTEQSLRLVKELNNLAEVKSIKNFISGAIGIVGLGVVALNQINERSKKKLVVSGPMGSFPGVLPTLANLMRKVAGEKEPHPETDKIDPNRQG